MALFFDFRVSKPYSDYRLDELCFCCKLIVVNFVVIKLNMFNKKIVIIKLNCNKVEHVQLY